MPFAGRTARQSSTLTSLPTILQTASDWGANCCHSGNDPHSSASKWLNPIQRKVRTSMSYATVSFTAGNSARGPV